MHCCPLNGGPPIVYVILAWFLDKCSIMLFIVQCCYYDWFNYMGVHIVFFFPPFSSFLYLSICTVVVIRRQLFVN